MARLLALLIPLSLFGSACASDAEQSAGTSTPTATEQEPVHFAAPDGWFTFEGIEPNSGSQVAWAATVGFRPEEEYDGFPDNTVKQLPPGGIVISVLGPRPFSGEADFPQLSAEPLVVSAERCVAEAYEGQPQPHIALCPIDRWVGDDQVMNVLVWFGSAAPGEQPSQALIDSANEELQRLTIPGDDR